MPYRGPSPWRLRSRSLGCVHSSSPSRGYDSLIGLSSGHTLLESVLDLLHHLVLPGVQGELDAAGVGLASGSRHLVATALRRAGARLLRGCLRVLPDLLVAIQVHLLEPVGGKVILDELGKLHLVLRGVVLLEHLHVLLHVRTQDLRLVLLRLVGGICTLLLRGE